MPNEYKRETIPGWVLSRSTRSEPVNVKLAAKYDQLWKAAAAHHEMALNGLLVWALQELKQHGVTEGQEPAEIGTGLRWPQRRYSITQKFAAAEIEMWTELASAYRVGRGRVAAIALVELYKRAPVDLSRGVMPRR